jgi:hypothetical protein
VQRKDDEEERIKSAAKRARDEAARSASSVDITVNDDVMETIRKAEEAREKERSRRDGKAEGGEDKPKFTSEIVSCPCHRRWSASVPARIAMHVHVGAVLWTSHSSRTDVRMITCRRRSWRWASGWLRSRTRRRRTAGMTLPMVRLHVLVCQS